MRNGPSDTVTHIPWSPDLWRWWEGLEKALSSVRCEETEILPVNNKSWLATQLHNSSGKYNFKPQKETPNPYTSIES